MTETDVCDDGLPSLRCSEARLRFLLRLSDALRALESPGEIQAIASRLLLEQLGADRVGYADLSPDTGVLTVVKDAADGVESLEGEYLIADFQTPLWERLGSGEPDVHGDVAADDVLTVAEKLAHARMDIGAVVNVPLFERGKLQAFFFLHFRQPHAFAAYEVEFVRETAERAWFAIDRARTKLALEASEARLAAAFESVPAGIAMLDSEGRTVVANSEYRRFLPGGIIPSQDLGVLAKWQAWDVDGEALAPRDFPGARAMRGERTVPGQEMLFGVEGGDQIWTSVASVPIHDDAGRITGQACVISDINALKRGSEALRESQARAQLLIDSIAVATWEAAPDGLVDTESPSWCAYTGQSFDDYKGRGWLAAIHPDDRAAVMTIWQNAVQEHYLIDGEYRLRRYDGCYRWMSRRARPLLDDAGRVVKWLGINIDIHDRKQMEEALRNSERRTRAVVEGVPQLLWRADHAGKWRWVSPQWVAFTGQSEANSGGNGWLRMIHPEDQETVRAAWANAEAIGGLAVEARLSGKDGTYRWYSLRAVPIRNDDGRVAEWIGSANDVDELRKAQARQDVLVAELQHRTRNLIAVVRALAEQTIDRAIDLDDFEQRFSDRLSALGRVQSLLSRATEARKVTFDELLHAELAAVGAADEEGLGARVELTGARGIPLRSSAVQTLALAVHELATNALKHGALAAAQPAGMLKIAWSVGANDEGRATLIVNWHERGVTLSNVAGTTASTGYGRHLVERGLPFQLGAETTYALTDGGLRCTIRVPMVATQDHEGKNNG